MKNRSVSFRWLLGVILVLGGAPAPTTCFGSEWTHGVETEDGAGLQFHAGTSVGQRALLTSIPAWSVSGGHFGLEAGVQWNKSLMLYACWQNQSQVFGFDGGMPALEWKEVGFGIGGRTFPFGRESGVHPFLGGGFIRTEGTLRAPGQEDSWVGVQGYGEGGIEYAFRSLLAVWIGLRIQGGQKGDRPGAEPSGPLWWTSATAMSRSASWVWGSGVGIYF